MSDAFFNEWDNCARCLTNIQMRTLEEKSAKSSSLAIRRPEDMARRANVGAAGWNAAAYFSVEIATAAIMVEEKAAILIKKRR